MSSRRIEGFFYGLFMDADLLRMTGAHSARRAAKAAAEIQQHSRPRAGAMASYTDSSA
jgi:hypothetical protein